MRVLCELETPRMTAIINFAVSVSTVLPGQGSVFSCIMLDLLAGYYLCGVYGNVLQAVSYIRCLYNYVSQSC